VVPDDELDDPGRGRTLRTRMTDLRARLREVDLSLRRIRRRGYTLPRR
jgi:hypothetical protein